MSFCGMSGTVDSQLPAAESGGVHARSPSSEKVALFRSLFRGREDVYPRRFESKKTGRAGYAPACGNEWVRGICEKPRIKCGDCPHRAFLPVTDEVIRWHLSGKDARSCIRHPESVAKLKSLAMMGNAIGRSPQFGSSMVSKVS